jgi:uncharacterized protein (TIGR04255 family)
MPQYKRPPIVEAVIEIRLDQPLSRDEVNELLKRLRPDYAFSEPHIAIDVEVDVAGRRTDFKEKSSGYRLASSDQADVLLVAATHISFSRLAPYLGWDALRVRAEGHWLTWKRVVGYRKIKRIGVRYINRIDIPAPAGEMIRVENYLRVYPETGRNEKLASYAMQLSGPLGDDNCWLVINTGLVPSPLLGYLSLMLDIDVSRDGEVPQRDAELWTLIDRMRMHKNNVFEASVTDRARELFNQ